MPSWISALVTSATDKMEEILLDVIGNYWEVYFGILFIGAMIGLAWFALRKVFGHRQM